MLKQYHPVDLIDKKKAIKEIMLEIVLGVLSRAGFFQKAAFYGGTALRIFHGLNRFSENLEFSLLTPDPSFKLSYYFLTLRKEVASYGLKVNISEKEKTMHSAIRSAFLKDSTKEHILFFFASDPAASFIPESEKIRIKFEVDTHPPPGASFEHKYRQLPAPYDISLYDFLIHDFKKWLADFNLHDMLLIKKEALFRKSVDFANCDVYHVLVRLFII